MSQIIFQQGEDLIVELPLVENAVNVDITTATSVRVQAYVTVNNVKQKVSAYNSTSKSGYGVCRQKSGGGNTNILQVLLKRAETMNFPVGVLRFFVIVTMPGATDFPLGINTQYDFDGIGTVLAGTAKDEIIP